MPYRILAIDGGGIHGYGSVVLLRRLVEKHPNLLDNVDLIAGTSIGGILSLGIAHGHPLNKVEENFIEGIPYAFNTNWVRMFFFLLGLTTKYDNTPFKKFLIGLFGKTRLEALNKKVVIPTFAMDNAAPVNRRWKAKIFHNFEGDDSDGLSRVVDVAMATSSAPIFFQSYQQYVDGALVANNPSLIALTQTQDPRAFIDPRPKLEDIRILSIGSIRNIFVSQRNVQWGWVAWALHIMHLISEKDILVTNYQCDKLIGKNFHRLELTINSPMDDIDTIGTIRKTAQNHNIDKTVDWLKNNW